MTPRSRPASKERIRPARRRVAFLPGTRAPRRGAATPAPFDKKKAIRTSFSVLFRGAEGSGGELRARFFAVAEGTIPT